MSVTTYTCHECGVTDRDVMEVIGGDNYCEDCAPDNRAMCRCELCGCGAEAEDHLCDYCASAHPDYHAHDCDDCEVSA